jgi:ferredoxin
MPTVLYSRKNLKIEAQLDKTIYDCFEENNYELPHGCLSGSCGACRIEVTAGADQLSDPKLIETNTVQSIKEGLIKSHPEIENKVIRLACRAKIVKSESDIEFDTLD